MAFGLCGAQRNQRDFRRDAEAHGGSDGAQSPIDIEYRERRLGVAKRRRHVASRVVSISKSAVIRRGHRERPEVRTGNVISNEASGTEAVIEDLHLDLAAVRVACERQLNSQLRSAIERVGIVREQNIWHVSTNERSKGGKQRQAMAARGGRALITDAEKIEMGAAKRELDIFVAKQLHAGLRKEALRGVFGAGINFMIAVAPETSQGRPKQANIVYANFQRGPAAGGELP